MGSWPVNHKESPCIQPSFIKPGGFPVAQYGPPTHDLAGLIIRTGLVEGTVQAGPTVVVV